MWRPVWKGLLAHKLRLALTAVAVVLGVGFVSGTYVFTDTIDQVFEDLYGQSAAGVDVYVRATAAYEGAMGPDREPIPATVADTVRGVRGVSEVQPAVDGFAQLIAPDGEPIAPFAPTIGVSWGPPPLTPLVLRDGREPRAAGEIAVDAHTAAQHGFSPGDRVGVVTPVGAGEYTVVGVVGFGEADNLAGATLTVFTLDEAQRAFGLAGQYTEIRVAAAQDVQAAELAARVQAALPAGFEASEGAAVAKQQAEAISEQLGFLRTALLVFALVALFVGSFIIANTFAIVVAQRTREFALLRALGASGRQVTLAVMAEAAVVGVVASAAGVALGAVIAKGIQGLMDAFGMSMPSGGLVLQPRTVGVGLALGTVVTLIAAVLPARRAARIPPVAALRAADAPVRAFPRRRAVAGVATLLVATALMALGLTGVVDQAPAVTGAGALVMFVGVSLLTPLAAGPMATVIGAAGARFGVPGRLARDNARANPRRTAATASALMIGLALVGFVATFAASLTSSAVAAVEDEIRADFVLRGPQAQIGIGFTPSVAAALTRLPELEAVSRLRIGMWREDAAAGNALVYGFDPRTIERVAKLDLVAGSFADAAADTVFIEEDTARARGLDVGETFTMVFARSGAQALRVAGVFAPSRILDSPYLLPNAAYERHYRNVLDHTVLVKAASGVSAEQARAAVERATADVPGLTIEDQAQFRETQRKQISQILALVTALLLLAVGIALLGITNTLALSVFERTREIGLLRAVGMSRRQVRAMIRWEALLVAVMGALLGVAMGALFGWAVVRALADEGISELTIPWLQFALGVVTAGAAGVVAGLLPARRAARLDVLEAISRS